jgi:hypothetical protein
VKPAALSSLANQPRMILVAAGPDWKGLASGFGEFFVSRLELTEYGGHLPVAAARNRIRSGACWLLPSIVDRANLPTGPSFKCRARIDQAPVSAGWGGKCRGEAIHLHEHRCRSPAVVR